MTYYQHVTDSLVEEAVLNAVNWNYNLTSFLFMIVSMS